MASIDDAEILKLSYLELRVADHVGRQRAAYAAERGLASRHPEAGKLTTSVENHILGCRAELAMAHHLNLDWRPNVGTIEGTDLGLDVEVRCRRVRSAYSAINAAQPIRSAMLSLNRRDRHKDDKAFVLVYASSEHPDDTLLAMGWRLGADVMQNQYWQSDPDMSDGVYRLPHAELKTIPRLLSFLDFRHEQRYDDRLRSYLCGEGHED